MSVAAQQVSRPRLSPAARLRRWLAALGGGRALALGLLALFVAVRAIDPAPVETVRLKIFDYYQLWQPRQSPPQPVAIVDLDEASFAAYGQWPWSRAVVAKLIANLIAAGVPAIAFDIVFPEPDRLSPGLVADSIPGLDEATRDGLRQLPSNEQILADVMRSGRVVLGQAGHPDPIGLEERSLGAKSVAFFGGDPRPFLPRYAGIVRNVPELEAAAAGRGIFSILPEFDGLVRRVPGFVAIGEDVLPTLSLELLRVATGQKTNVVKTDEAGVSSLVVGRQPIPTDRNGRLWVHYAPHDPAKYVSAKDVLDGTVPQGRLAGHLVFIGTSSTGLVDIKATPVDSAMPGVEVHAQLLETILTGSHLERPNYALGAELVVTVLAGVAMIVLVPLLGAVWTLLLGAGLAAGLGAMSVYLYLEERLLIDFAYPMGASLAVYAILSYASYYNEERSRQQVRNAFGHYLSPAMVERLADDPDSLSLGGEMRDMTLLFCDVRGFTTISEQFDAEGLTRLINRFLTPMTEVILNRNGTIDKYMGDCIMAFWNAPLDDRDHARNACHAALGMRSALAELNETLRGEAEADGRKHIPINIGIGLDTGECCVGNVGSDQRFDYSVLGDTVNLASRLEGQSKTYGVTTIVGEPTHDRAPDMAMLEVDLIQVKGKTRPERIFVLLGDETMAAADDFKALKAAQDDLLARYRAQDWSGARAAATTCRGLMPELGLGALYDLFEARIAAFEADPPGADWDGVFTAETK